MEHSEGSFQGSGGLVLYRQSWRPDGPARAALALVHGLGEHSGRFQNIVNYLVPHGFAVHSFDLRGHGRSPGRRAYINSWDDYREDVRAFVRQVGQDEPDRPLFLMGHSMGGLIVLEYVLHHPDGLRGVIASAPGLDVGGISPVALFLGRALSGIWPTFTVSSGLDATGLSRDPAVVQAYKDDPLVHGKGTARLGVEGPAAIQRVHAHTADFKLPLLILHGSADRLTNPKISRAFFDKLTTPDKTYLAYEGGYHESHNDLHHQQATADLLHWLEARL
jgi:alpha-beta hydrolase superfamily lysophospholipase